MVGEQHHTTEIQQGGFLLLLAAVTILFVWISWPFFTPLLWAALAAIMFQGLYRRVLRNMRGRRNPAAIVTLTIIFLAIVVPALWIGSLVVKETLALIEQMQQNPVDLAAWYESVHTRLPDVLQEAANRNGWSDMGEAQLRLQEILAASSGWLASEAVSIGSGALGFFLSLGVALYVLYFLIRDGSRIGETILHSAPLDRDIADRLAERFLGIVRAVIKGSGVVGIVQGALGGIVLAIAGVPSALLLGVLMVFLALIPAIGTALVWLPIGIYMLVTGEVWQGLFILGSGFFVISLVDNVLRPILVGRDTGIPDWIILISTLGGLAIAGVSGIVLGPLVAGLFLASWSILQEQRAEDEESAARYRTKVSKDGKARPYSDHPEPVEPHEIF